VQLTVRNTAILATAGWKWKMCREHKRWCVSDLCARGLAQLVKIAKMYSLRNIIILPTTVCFAKDNNITFNYLISEI